MTRINKQRFLPELGKLLTFMAEEDRQTALNMYSRLFDDAEDEQLLMDLLVSPTRQAVVIARTYDTKERKQQLESPEGEEETPAFVLAIDKIYQQVAPHHGESAEEDRERETDEPGLVNQFSLFPDDAHPIDDSEYVPFQIDAEAVSLEPETEESRPEAAPAAAEEVEAPAEETPAEETPAEEGAETEPAPERAVPAEEQPLPPSVPAEEPAAAVIPAPEAEAPAEKLPAEHQEEKTPAKLNAADYDLDFIPETRRKTRVFLLILYILLAIPLTLAGIVLLLIPTLLALALALAVIVLGSAALVVAFSGFSRLADLLIVLGTAAIVLALGLLLLWLFVWFIGGAIGGLIRGVVELGRKWCFEEVPV